MAGEQIVAFAHKPDEYMQEVDAFEHDRLIRNILVDCFLKKARMLGVVHRLLQVMRDMVAVVPAFHVVLRVDAGNAVFIRIARIITAYKGMLGPVTHHCDQAIQEEWNDEDHEGCRPIDKAHGNTEQNENDLSTYGTHEESLTFLPEEIRRKMIYARE